MVEFIVQVFATKLPGELRVTSHVLANSNPAKVRGNPSFMVQKDRSVSPTSIDMPL